MIRLKILVLIGVLIIGTAACSGSNSSGSGDGSGTLPTYSDAQTAFSEGDRLLEANKVEMAVSAYRQAIAMDPNMADAHFKLGIALALLESDSKEAAKEDVSANGETAAEKTESQKAFAAAIEAYKKKVSENPNDASAHFNLGRSYAKLDKDESAQQSLREALRLNPDDNDIRIELADVLMKLTRYGEAAGLYRKALEVDPQNFDLEDRIEEAMAGRKRETFVGPSPSPTVSPSPSPSPSEWEEDGVDLVPAPPINQRPAPKASPDKSKPKPSAW